MYKTPVQVFAHYPVTPLAQAIKKSTEEVQVVEQEAESAGQELTFVAPAPMLRPESEHRPDYQPPGEGIGLSIVKKLCELLDASLELETERGKGSTFGLCSRATTKPSALQLDRRMRERR